MSESGWKTASADPGDAVQGGFLDDVDGTIVKARTVMFDYAGKRDASPALQLTIAVEGADKLRVEHLTAGRADKVRASKDGKTFLTQGGRGLSASCKAMLFLASLSTAGFPKKLWSDVSSDFSGLEGLYCHFGMVTMQRIRDDSGEEKKAPQALTVTEIHKLPSENKGWRKAVEEMLAKAEEDDADEDEEKPAKKSKSKPVEDEDEDEPASDTSDDDDADEDKGDSEAEEVAEEAVVTLLKDKKNAKGVSLDDVVTLAFPLFKQHAKKRAITELLQDEDWLKDKARAFRVKGDTIVKK